MPKTSTKPEKELLLQLERATKRDQADTRGEGSREGELKGCLLVEGGDKVPGGISTEQRMLLELGDLDAAALVANKVAGVVHRLEGEAMGVSKSGAEVEGGILGEQGISTVAIVLVEVPVLVAQVVAGVVHRLEGDGGLAVHVVAGGKTVDQSPGGVLVVEVVVLVSIGPCLAVAVADVVGGEVVGADRHGAGVHKVPGGIGAVKAGLLEVGDLHAAALVANEVGGVVHRLEGHGMGISETMTDVEAGILGEELIVLAGMLVEVPVLVAQEVAPG